MFSKETIAQEATKYLPAKYLLLAVYLIAVFSVFAFFFLHHSRRPILAKYRVLCGNVLQTHLIVIQRMGFFPNSLKANACDEIIFLNKDLGSHQVAFGDHPLHLAYPGYNEKLLAPGRSISILLRAYGAYKIHDHLHEELEGLITISRL